MSDDERAASDAERSDDARVKGASGRPRQGPSTRSRILRTSASLFHRRGYDRTSLDDIAVELGIRKPSLYHHFRSKEDILIECIRLGHAKLVECLGTCDRPEHSGREALETFLKCYITAVTDDISFTVMTADERVMTDEAKRFFMEIRRSLNREVGERIEKGLADGTIKTSNKLLSTYAIFGMFNWIARWHDQKQEIAVSEVLDHFSDLLFDGMSGKAD